MTSYSMKPMERKRYLERIGISNHWEELKPNEETLFFLHRAHLFNIPFENLDVHMGIPISIDLSKIYNKVVERKRGGFCYELNTLWSTFLKDIGFIIELFACEVSIGESIWSEKTHIMPMIKTNNQSIFISDVGFGDCSFEPLLFSQLIESFVEDSIHRKYRVIQNQDFFVLQRMGGIEIKWKDVIRWKNQSFDLYDPIFSKGCQIVQTSPTSPFIKKIVVSIITKTGRKTISGLTLIETDWTTFEKKHRNIDEREFFELLETLFQLSFTKQERNLLSLDSSKKAPIQIFYF